MSLVAAATQTLLACARRAPAALGDGCTPPALLARSSTFGSGGLMEAVGGSLVSPHQAAAAAVCAFDSTLPCIFPPPPQKSAKTITLAPRAGPTGGAGFAFPATSSSLIFPVTAAAKRRRQHRVLVPAAVMPAAVAATAQGTPDVGPAGQLKAGTAAWRCFLPFAAIVTTRLLAVLLLLALGMPKTVPTLLLLLPCMLLPTLGRLTAVRGCWEEKARLRVGNRTLLPSICEAIVLSVVLLLLLSLCCGGKALTDCPQLSLITLHTQLRLPERPIGRTESHSQNRVRVFAFDPTFPVYGGTYIPLC